MKEAENVRCPDVTMNPITWQVEQVTEKLGGQLSTSSTAKVKVFCLIEVLPTCIIKFYNYSSQQVFWTFSVIQ